MSKPVLEMMRQQIEYKGWTTLAEISRFTGIKLSAVWEVAFANREFTKQKNTRIIRVDPWTPLREQLWASGKFYKIDSYGAWSVEGHGIVFPADTNGALIERLQRSHTTGGFGDSYTIKVIDASPENIAAVEAEGVRPWSEAVIDDQLWKE